MKRESWTGRISALASPWWNGDGEKRASFSFEPEGNPEPAKPGSLEHFLVERYLLFTESRSGQLLKGRVKHDPYRISPAALKVWNVGLIEQVGFRRPAESPDHILYGPGVDVELSRLERVH